MFIGEEMSENSHVEGYSMWKTTERDHSSESNITKLNTWPFPEVDGSAALEDKSLLM